MMRERERERETDRQTDRLIFICTAENFMPELTGTTKVLVHVNVHHYLYWEWHVLTR